MTTGWPQNKQDLRWPSSAEDDSGSDSQARGGVATDSDRSGAIGEFGGEHPSGPLPVTPPGRQRKFGRKSRDDFAVGGPDDADYDWIRYLGEAGPAQDSTRRTAAPRPAAPRPADAARPATTGRPDGPPAFAAMPIRAAQPADPRPYDSWRTDTGPALAPDREHRGRSRWRPESQRDAAVHQDEARRTGPFAGPAATEPHQGPQAGQGQAAPSAADARRRLRSRADNVAALAAAGRAAAQSVPEQQLRPANQHPFQGAGPATAADGRPLVADARPDADAGSRPAGKLKRGRRKDRNPAPAQAAAPLAPATGREAGRKRTPLQSPPPQNLSPERLSPQRPSREQVAPRPQMAAASAPAPALTGRVLPAPASAAPAATAPTPVTSPEAAAAPARASALTVVAAPAKAPAVRRQARKKARRRTRVAMIAGAVVVLAAGGYGAMKFLPGRTGPAHSITAPEKLLAYTQNPELANSLGAAQLRAEIVSKGNGEASHVVDAVYEDSTGQAAKAAPLIILFVGGNLSGSASSFIASFTGMPGAFTTSAGHLGGQAACVPGTGGHPAECAWADNNTFGLIASPTMGASALGTELRAMRPLVEHQAK